MYPENIVRNTIVLLLLIAAGVASRFVFIDIPNFKPVAAIALFAAFWFRSYWVAGLALLLVMLVSNSGLESCPWQVSTGVFLGLAVAVLLGHRLRNRFHSFDDARAKPIGFASLTACSALIMAVSFFLISNFSVWAMGQWYPLTMNGFIHCYAAAIPFFKYTLFGDLFFTTTIFSLWFVLEYSLASKIQPEKHQKRLIGV